MQYDRKQNCSMVKEDNASSGRRFPLVRNLKEKASKFQLYQMLIQENTKNHT